MRETSRIRGSTYSAPFVRPPLTTGEDPCFYLLKTILFELYDAVVVHHLSADDGQERPDAPEFIVGDREVVSVEYCEVGVVAGFDRPDVIFPDKPLVGRRGEP